MRQHEVDEFVKRPIPPPFPNKENFISAEEQYICRVSGKSIVLIIKTPAHGAAV